MERVVVVGAGKRKTPDIKPKFYQLTGNYFNALGLYGLIFAKTYLQVSGMHNQKQNVTRTESAEEIPSCFADDNYTVASKGCHFLVIDAASDIGGTWAEDRLYPNLLSQNSYGLYEFSDMSLAETVPDEDEDDANSQFIPGWKINRYLNAWVEKWDLRRHIKLNSKVTKVRRLHTGEWELTIAVSDDTGYSKVTSIICDKLILATGLTSIPILPRIETPDDTKINGSKMIHAKDIGGWARHQLGYRPFSKPARNEDAIDSSHIASPKKVVVYGGAKSAFDLVHFFATLHKKNPAWNLRSTPEDPLQVHWVVRVTGGGPAWMVSPTSSLPNGEVVASDKAASTRLLHYLSPCSYELPKQLDGVGSWLVRLLYGNPLGRWVMRYVWNSVDRDLEVSAQYDSGPKMQKLRPNQSLISCGAGVGIANQPDLWEVLKSSNVHVYRSTISHIKEMSSQSLFQEKDETKIRLKLQNDEEIEDVDLIVHATGYNPIVPIQFDPPSLRLDLGLSSLLVSDKHDEKSEQECENMIRVSIDSETKRFCQVWQDLDSKIEPRVKERLLLTGCDPVKRETASWSDNEQYFTYRLFRRMVAPDLVAKGDRSFAILGVLFTSTIAVVAEVQALWAAAFLTGGFDKTYCTCNLTNPPKPLRFRDLSRASMEDSISEDIVLGSMTAAELNVDAIHYNDMLLQDLGLNHLRLGGGRWAELTGVYMPRTYAGIVEEWIARRDFRQLSSESRGFP